MSDGDDPAADDGAEQQTASAVDPVEHRSRERRIDREAREAQQFWRNVFASEVGRREMWRILDAAHAFEERFACGPNGFPQAEATWFHAGEQALGQRLFLTWQRHDRDGVHHMLDEHDPRFAKPKSRRARKAD